MRKRLSFDKKKSKEIEKINDYINDEESDLFNLNLNSNTNSKSKTKTRTLCIILDLYTRIIQKTEINKCICEPKITIDEVDNLNIFHENETIFNLEITYLPNNQIKFEEVINKLKQLGYPLTKSLISIYSVKINEYLFIGADPIENKLILEENEFGSLNILKLRVNSFIEAKIIINNLNTNNFNEENFKMKKEKEEKEDKKEKEEKKEIKEKKEKKGKKMNKNNKNTRTKERKIGYIIEKVNRWRKYYNGYQDENGKFTKVSLDEAARKIDISKKSLDDYLLQLRLGRKYGFDFNLNKNERVGKLRAFVKENRKKF
jgi:hypothetical protein